MEGLRSALDHQVGKDLVGQVQNRGGNHTSADQSDELWFGQVTGRPIGPRLAAVFISLLHQILVQGWCVGQK